MHRATPSAPWKAGTGTASARRRRGWTPAVVAATLALAGVGVFAVGRDEPAPADVAHERGVDPPPGPSRDDVAVATARTYLTALHAGDADTVSAIANGDVQRVAADRNLAAMFGAAYTIDDRPIVGRCSATDEDDGITGASAPGEEPFVEVHCEVSSRDPVHLELGVEDSVTRIWVFDDGTVGRPARRWRRRDTAPADWAYSDHLRRFHDARYRAACAPGAYWPGTVHVSANLALHAACADVWAPLAGDVVDWIRGQRPRPAG